MKCPYRKIIKHQTMGISSTDTIDIEEFAECYERDCPLYVPESKSGEATISAACARSDMEWSGKVVNT